ncbi:MAG: M20/M25/M40 family metallo-hydrolase [Saprospiraceae bacterium]|nr:M20/M25/M40 family metallo-hydrolase [Saprospiraceae bacterium]
MKLIQHGAFLLCLSLISTGAQAQAAYNQEREAFQVKAIYDEVLLNGQCYAWLEHLTTRIGHRLSGSSGAAAAIEYTRQMMDTLGLDSVWLQPCVVPRWHRGDPEIVRIVNAPSVGSLDLNALALGNSVGTGPDGVSAEVIEVLSLDELRALPDATVRGKIVFFNRPLDVTLVNTFQAYGRAVDQRGTGPVVAARKGAVAALVRSMTTALDDVPHTGSTRIDPDGANIPAVAISTNDAELLSRLLMRESVRVFIRTTCQMLEPVQSYNVIGQINGSERPDEIILVGGHLDSWDVGHGAHDDGTGCVQSIEVMRTLLARGYRPRRTIRCVMFMNEENGLVGATTYAAVSNERNEFHLAAIESDAGGFVPLGFTCAARQELQEAYLANVAKWWDVLAARGLYIRPGGSGADINPLRSQGGLLFGLRPDSQRYFDYHHTAIDTFDKVNERELKLGAAAMTSLVYLLDKYLNRAK